MMVQWSRRRWLTTQGIGLAMLVPIGRRYRLTRGPITDKLARQSEQIDPTPWQALAQRAVEAAEAAGARYTDVRLTRDVHHSYSVSGMYDGLYVPGLSSVMFADDPVPRVVLAEETIGIGIRVLVGGYWGFAASTVISPDEVVRLASDAVAQAKENLKGPAWSVDLGKSPVVTGTWTTPSRIDPFVIPIEEKIDHIMYWRRCAREAGLGFVGRGVPSWLGFVRQERVTATSEGSLFTQTLYESGGEIFVAKDEDQGLNALRQHGGVVMVHDISMLGTGWERFLDAKIPEQFSSGQLAQELAQKSAIPHRTAAIGKYTLVCDGTTMSSLVETTLGVATQLDRALGYEANAGGTSWINDPLRMVGTEQITSAMVTLTANRSAPRQLATVKWDDEGVTPEPFMLIKNGVLVDFQTTREQAAWLAPYYQQRNLPVCSHGCAGSQSAHFNVIQQMPNLALEPVGETILLTDLVGSVKDGILIEGGSVDEMDSQARTGLLRGEMRKITNGQLGPMLDGGAVLLNSQTLWESIKALGGPGTVGGTDFSAPVTRGDWIKEIFASMTGGFKRGVKGEPAQQMSFSVRAAAAVIANQPMINPNKRI